jgi:lysophospholipase L1-like esterase
MVQRLAQEGNLRPAVVLNFGTNAGLKHESSLTAMREALDTLGPDRRIVLVTVVGVSYWIPETNATYEQVAAEYPNVAVADWHAVVARDPGLLHSDETHPNMEGIGVYADLIAETFEQLGPG